MKFALGAAAAITGASALIYLLLRPRKRHLDPGKRRHAAPCTVSSSEEHSIGKRKEHVETDVSKNNEDSSAFQNFNGHVSLDDVTSSLSHTDTDGKDSHAARKRHGSFVEKDFSLDSDIKDITNVKKQHSLVVEKDFSLDGDISSEKEVGQYECVETKVVDRSSHFPLHSSGTTLSGSSDGPNTVAAGYSLCELSSDDLSNAAAEEEISSVRILEAQAKVPAVSLEENLQNNKDCFDDDIQGKTQTTEVQRASSSYYTPEEELVTSTSVCNAFESISALPESEQGIISHEKSNTSVVNLSSSCTTLVREDMVSSTHHDYVSSIPTKSLQEESYSTVHSSKEESPEGALSVDTETVSSSNIIESEGVSSTAVLDSRVDLSSINQKESSKLPIVELEKVEIVDNLDKNILESVAPLQNEVKTHLKSSGDKVPTEANETDMAVCLAEAELHTPMSEAEAPTKSSGSLVSEGPLENSTSSQEENHQQGCVSEDPVTEQPDVTEVSVSSVEPLDTILKSNDPCESEINVSRATKECASAPKDSDDNLVNKSSLESSNLSQNSESDLEHSNVAQSSKLDLTLSSVPKVSDDTLLDQSNLNNKSESGIECSEFTPSSESDLPLSPVTKVNELVTKEDPVPSSNLKEEKLLEESGNLKSDIKCNEDVKEDMPETSLVEKESHSITKVEEEIIDCKATVEKENPIIKNDEIEVIPNTVDKTAITQEIPVFSVKNSEATSVDGTQNSFADLDTKGNASEQIMTSVETVSPSAQEPVVEVLRTNSEHESSLKFTKEDSPFSVGDSQEKQSYKERVRNPRGSSVGSTPECVVQEKESEEVVGLDLDQAEKELCSLINDPHDDSVSSFVVKEKLSAPSSQVTKVESVASPPPVKEIVIVDSTKDSEISTKQEPSPSKISKSRREGPSSKSTEKSRNKSYKDRVRNSQGNSTSESNHSAEAGDHTCDNNNRNLKSTESSQSSSSEIEPETMFNPSAFPVTRQEQYIFYEFEIPQTLVGRLIGRKGAFVNKIKATTEASIVVGPHKDRRFKMCSVEGTRQQVDAALDMIRDYFPIDRYPELTLAQVFNRSTALPPVQAAINTPAMQIELAAGVVVEVRVSAVVSGNELWIQQPLHPSYSALQRLQACMNLNYADGSTTPQIPTPVLEGTVCVAQINSQWLRSQVISAAEDGAVIVLLDIGGTVSLPASALRQIRYDYMTLPFQAAQCLLHGIQPSSEQGWDDTSAVVLEELVSGTILSATVLSYTQDGVPLVNLYRRDQDEYVFLNERLVNLGHAQWITPPLSS